jgi:hypothetical protein
MMEGNRKDHNCFAFINLLLSVKRMYTDPTLIFLWSNVSSTLIQEIHQVHWPHYLANLNVVLFWRNNQFVFVLYLWKNDNIISSFIDTYLLILKYRKTFKGSKQSYLPNPLESLWWQVFCKKWPLLRIKIFRYFNCDCHKILKNG